MKKTLALFLALMLLFSMTAVASASSVVDRTTLEKKDWNDPDLEVKIRWSGYNFYEFVLPTGECLVMDPAIDYNEPTEDSHNEFNYSPTVIRDGTMTAGDYVYGADYILLTHNHGDHTNVISDILAKYPDAHVVMNEFQWPILLIQEELPSTLYLHKAGSLDKFTFHGFMLETVRSNHNLSKGPQFEKTTYVDEDGNVDFYSLYKKLYDSMITNMKITTDSGFEILIWNSEMQADGLGFEDRAWFYQDSQPDVFMYQVAGASFDYDRRNPNCQHMGEWIASVDAAFGMPEHQQHFAYEELDSMAAEFGAICDAQGVDTTFFTPETGVWYGLTRDGAGNINVYLVDEPAK